MTEPNEATEATDARRLELVAAAQRQWIDALTDLTAFGAVAHDPS